MQFPYYFLSANSYISRFTLQALIRCHLFYTVYSKQLRDRPISLSLNLNPREVFKNGIGMHTEPNHYPWIFDVRQQVTSQ